MKHIVVLTGAGISKESGLSTFRDDGGLWTRVKAEELASIQGYRKDRAKVLAFYNERRKNLLNVDPNHAHRVLAELEKEYKVSIITQNVGDFYEQDLYGFEHIKTTAVAGVDILKERLKSL